MEFKFDLANGDENQRTLIVEPWAEEFSLPPNCIVTVVVEAPDYRTLHIEIKGEFVICYLWAGATAEIYADGKSISSNLLKNPVPYI